jgi:uncharacterized protein HemY
MSLTQISNPYETIEMLIALKQFQDAEKELKQISNKTAYWHFLYSQIFIHKAWFDSAKSHLEKAISMNPYNDVYHHELAKLMARKEQYEQQYQHSKKKRDLDCCGCTEICESGCCELICLDICCECTYVNCF